MSSVNTSKVMDNVTRYTDLAIKWGKRTNVNPALILAVIDQESLGNPTASRYESSYAHKPKVIEIATKTRLPKADIASSHGLMQLMVTTAWGYMSGADKLNPKKTLRDPDKNIRYGAAHLSALASKNNGDIEAIAGAYNGAGKNSKYAKDVYKLYQKYSAYLKEVEQNERI